MADMRSRSSDHSWRAVAAAQDGVLTLRQAADAGLSPSDVKVRVRRGEWRGLLRGAYLIDADMHTETPPRALIRAAALVVPTGVVCGRSAAAVLGLRGVYLPHGPAEIAVPSGRPVMARHGLSVRQIAVPGQHVTTVDGMRVTSPLWTVGDLLLWLERMEAVGVLDAAMHDGRLVVGDLVAFEDILAHRPGVVAARGRIRESDGRAESPLETRVRLICVDGGVPPDTLQHPVLDRYGSLLGYGDMAWTAVRLIGEADGRSVHDTTAALYRDRRRANDFRAAGWTMIRFTWADTYTPAYVVSVVRRAHATAA
jgi:very-short-patch-repair endonuclease